MPPPEASLADRLSAGAAALGIALSTSQRDALLAYQALIAKWNRVYNLTAVRDTDGMLTHHLLDSLAVVPPLARHVPERKAQVVRLLDVGSGAGLPGVVLAVLRPGLQVVCVDTVGKKATFIRQVAAELGLPNLTAEHSRVENLKTAPFDVITSRAFASLIDLVSLTAQLLAPAGVWMAMKGRTPDDEMAHLPATVNVFHVEQLQVPELDAERCLVWMKPVQRVA
jgi:16S rRNA (guanine527-N7)-methyltransferase